MFPSFPNLRQLLRGVIDAKTEQGHITDGLVGELDALPDSYDAIDDFARRLVDLPMRDDWPYMEPSDWEGIQGECDPQRPRGPIARVDLADSAQRVRTAFKASVCGCVLGKPLEINPNLADIRRGLEAIGEWPMRDYVSVEIRPHLPRPLHHSWRETCREHITYAAPDDDINYTILGMLILERGGIEFSRDDVRRIWLAQLPIDYTFGPERTTLVKAGIASVGRESPDMEQWTTLLNPRDELCGALIRADAYGYACPGRPELAAELAFRDASFTHRRNGIYGTMFIAAAIAAAQVVSDPLEIFHIALKYIPQRSRLHRIAADSLQQVADATDWLDAYGRIHQRYGEFTHCRIFQEIGTVINTLRFAEDIGDGICKQVSQGNDTDSFGATAGSILGAFFGPGHLDDRWLRPFNDQIHAALAQFYEQSISAIADRMAKLPARIAAELASSGSTGAP